MESFSSFQLIPYVEVFLLAEPLNGVPVEKQLFWNQTPFSEIFPKIISAKTILINTDRFQEWSEFLIACKQDREFDFSVKLFLFFASADSLTAEQLSPLQQTFPSAQFWVKNLLGNLPNTLLLPLGIDASTGSFCFTDPSKIEKKYPLVITNFTINSTPRIEFLKFLDDHPQLEPLFVKDRMEKQTFYTFLQDFYFTVCPCGSGFDTYRFWEALSAGCIPIVKYVPFFDTLRDQYPNLPMIVLQSWDDLLTLLPTLTPESYKKIWNGANLDYLSKDYWLLKLSEIVNTP